MAVFDVFPDNIKLPLISTPNVYVFVPFLKLKTEPSKVKFDSALAEFASLFEVKILLSA